MRIRSLAAAVTAAASCLVPLTASTATAADEPVRGVPWSASHQTATASGGRWVERPSTGFQNQLVAEGKLSNTGEGCYSLWTRFQFDFVPTPPRKQAAICGTGSVEVLVRQAYQPTTTGSVTVCKGTENTKDCGAWQNITSWPVSRP